MRLPDIAWPILGCLTAAAQCRTSRGRLTAQLWPDQDEEGARHRLATALWRIRSALDGLPLIRSQGEIVALQLHPALWIDAIAVERRLQRAVAAPETLASPVARRRLAHALSAYRGEFLAERDQEWIMVRRARLRTLHLDALYALAVAAAHAGAWGEARISAGALCEVEPLREDAQRLLIEAHARCGNRALALQQYRQCEAVLARELGVAPMPETQALAVEIGGRSALRVDRILAPVSPPISLHAALAEVRSRAAETLAIVDRALNA